MKKLADWFYYTLLSVVIIGLVLSAVVVMLQSPHMQTAIENEIVSPYGNCSFCESHPAVEDGGACAGCEERFERHAGDDE